MYGVWLLYDWWLLLAQSAVQITIKIPPVIWKANTAYNIDELRVVFKLMLGIYNILDKFISNFQMEMIMKLIFLIFHKS